MFMIGQEKIRCDLRQFSSHFMVIQGPVGSGKKTLIKCVADNPVWIDVKVDAIREMIDMSKRAHNKLFVVADADKMSVQAQNALLKVVEECINDNYFILTVESADSLLSTIISRAHVYSMDAYTKAEIKQYARHIGIESVDALEICSDLCDVPNEVQMLKSYGVKPFYDYVGLVLDNIASVSGANAFKIADKIALKDEADKYDVALFLRAFNRQCMHKTFADENIFENYINAIITTTKYIRQLKIKGINKQSLIDLWILDIRKDMM